MSLAFQGDKINGQQSICIYGRVFLQPQVAIYIRIIEE